MSVKKKNLEVKTPKRAPRPGEGRPPSYQNEYPRLLIEHMKRGGSFRSFCGYLGIKHQTAYEWAEKYEEFGDAKKTGESMSYFWWEEQGIKGLWVETKDGPVLNTTLWYMNMKNRFGWRDKHEVESTNTTTNKIDESQLNILAGIVEDLRKAKK